MKKRSYIRDLIVYVVTSIRHLLLKGQFRLFITDIFSFAAWRTYRISSKGTLDYRIPWLVFSSISFVNKWLKKEMRVFEYGSGGSTLYFAAKVEQVISIEHNSEWYAYAKNAIHSSGLTNIDYALVEPQLLQNTAEYDCSNPASYVSCFTEYKGYEFSTYAKAIDRYADASFDLVIVDGRVRHSCIAHSMQKVKQHGILLLDNADRTYYLAPFPELYDQRKWKEMSFVGHFPFGPASVLNTTKLFMKR